MSPDGANLFVTALEDDSLVNFTRSPTTGELLFLEAIFATDPGTSGLAGIGWLDVSPGGEHVYVTGSNDHAIVLFARGDGFGELTFVESLQNGVDVPAGLGEATNVSVSPDGVLVHVTAPGDQALAQFVRDGATGRLAFLGAAFEGEDGVVGLDLSFGVVTHGKHVYATALLGNSVAFFSGHSFVFADGFESGDTSAWALP